MKSGDLMKVSCFAFVWAFASASSPNQMSQEGFERSTMMKEHDAFFMADMNTRRLSNGGKGRYRYDDDGDDYGKGKGNGYGNPYSLKSGKGKGGYDDEDYEGGYGEEYSKSGKWPKSYKAKGGYDYDDDNYAEYGKGSKGYKGKGGKGGYKSYKSGRGKGGYGKSSKGYKGYKSGKGKGRYEYDGDYSGKGSKGGYGGYSESGKGKGGYEYDDDYDGKGSKGGHEIYSKSAKGKGRYEYDYDDYAGKGSKGGYGGYSKSGKGKRGHDDDDDAGYSKGSKGYKVYKSSKGKGGYDNDDDYSGKGGKGEYGGYSKSGKGKGGYSKGSKGYKGKTGKGYKSYKSGKVRGGYDYDIDDYIGKSSKGYKGIKTGTGYGKSTKKGKYHDYYHGDDGYDNNNDDQHDEYEDPTASPTASPTTSHTEMPTQGDGIYRSDDGVVGCHPFDDSGDLIYAGETQKKSIFFEFEMATNADASDNGGIDDELFEVELAFAEFLAGISNCKSQHLQNSHGRHLAAIGFDPSPRDEVVGECGEKCSTIGSTMSITTDGESTKEDICTLIDQLANFASEYEAGSIEGVESLDIDTSTASVDGTKCTDDPPNPPTIPVSSIITQDELNDDDNFDSIYPIVVAAAFFIIAAALFVRRRKRKVREEEERRLRALEADFEEDDEQFAFAAGYRNGTLNAVNVHKCHSAQCSSCSTSHGKTEFLPLANVDKWVNQRQEAVEVEASEESSPDFPDVPEDESLPPPPPEFPDDESPPLESKNEERSRLIEDARRVLAEGSTDPLDHSLRGRVLGEDTPHVDQVEADRLDDQLRGLPTVLEDSEDSDVTPRVLRRGADSDSI